MSASRGIRRRVLQLQRPLNQLSNFVILSVAGDRLMPLQHSASVGVDNENRMLAGIEQDRIRSLAPNAFLR